MPLTSPEYVTGRRLWLLAMPSTVRPRAVGIEGGDPGLMPGMVSAVVRSVGGTGTLSIYSGGPTDAFSVRVEFPVGGALGTATYRYRLQDADSYTLVQTTPANGVIELVESGLYLALSGTFAGGEAHTFTTVESAQQRELRKGVCGEIARTLRTRGQLPLEDWGVDLELLAARCIAWEMLGLKGYQPKSEHDRLVMIRAKRSWSELRKLREEMEQSDLPGQAKVAGVAVSSQEAQGVGLW